MPRLYLCSATGALSAEAAPVGGGVAVLEALLPHLQADFQITLLTPGREDRADGVRQQLRVPQLADAAPARILRLNARQYARFALDWEAALARYFSDMSPADTLILANDTAEGPPFGLLHANGFRQTALLHVIVSEFFSRRYLQQPLGLPLSGKHLARAWRGAERLGLAQHAPAIAQLVWEKEGSLARCVDLPLTPSLRAARDLTASYPHTGVAQRLQITPWGVIGDADPHLRQQRRDTLRGLGADPNRFTLLTLSRISPEKRIHLLLEALQLIEAQSPSSAERLQLIIAGAPAYMGGERYHQRLLRLARPLKRAAVHFVGYVSGEAKWRLFAAADLFCSPSFYEAYGLTIAQALGSGTPVLAAPHDGAHATLGPTPGEAGERGWLAQPHPRAFAAAVRRALHDDELGRLPARRRAAAQWAAQHPFLHTADRLIRLFHTLLQDE